jgi:G protein-coupled receptor Mth (Methuselah protein)
VSELIYFNGPVLILLVLNLYFFGTTAIGLWRLKKESKKVLRGGDSRVHTRNHNEHDKDRLALYVKLFLLMGVTWIMEVVSWAVGGPNSIWFITDTINCLRGVLIFWFCVWSNKTMRTALKERFYPFKKSKKFSLAERATTVFNISSKVDSTHN